MRRALAGLLAALLLVACAAPGPPRVEVRDAWARPAAAGEVAAAYLTLHNAGGADRLVAVECDAAEAVELHTTVSSGGIFQMQPAPGLEVPAGGDAELRPGGGHIMLVRLRRDLQAGQTLTLTLRFERSAPITVQAQVRLR